MGHVGPDQHVADPQLVGTRRFEATEDVGLLSQSGALQSTVLQVLADGALRHADAVARQQDGAELSGGAGRQLLPQLAGFLQQLGVAACNAQVSARLRLESGQALLTIGAQPAIECAAGEMVQPAIRQPEDGQTADHQTDDDLVYNHQTAAHDHRTEDHQVEDHQMRTEDDHIQDHQPEEDSLV